MPIPANYYYIKKYIHISLLLQYKYHFVFSSSYYIYVVGLYVYMANIVNSFNTIKTPSTFRIPRNDKTRILSASPFQLSQFQQLTITITIKNTNSLQNTHFLQLQIIVFAWQSVGIYEVIWNIQVKNLVYCN